MSVRKLVILIEYSKSDILDDLYENIRKMGGVNSIRIFKESSIIKVLYDDAAVKYEKILDRISSLGTSVKKFVEFETSARDEEEGYVSLKIEKILAGLISIIVFFLSEKLYTNKYIAFILYFVVVLWFSHDFKNEFKKTSKLVNIYSFTILYFFSFFLYKLLLLFLPGLVRYDFINWYEAMSLVFIVYFGFSISKYLTSNVSFDFRSFLPKFFKIKIINGLEKKDWKSVRIDDTLVYEKGDLVGCDAIIRKGNCVVDESLIKGSSVFENKSEGDKIYCGSFIFDGFVEAKASTEPESSLIFSYIKNSFSKKYRKFTLKKIPFMIYENYIFLLPLIFIVFMFFSLRGLTGFLWVESIFIFFFITYPYLIWLIFPISYAFLLSSSIKRGFFIKNNDSIELLSDANTIFFLSDKYVDYKTLKKLKSEGLELVLLSDKHYIEKEFEDVFDEIYFGIDFSEKEGFILKKKIENKRIIGVGDCIYDLDSLFECDVSVIVSLHPESKFLPCDIVFLKKDSSLIYELISYSRFIINVVEKNSFLVILLHFFVLPFVILILGVMNKIEMIENALIFTSFSIMALISLNSIRVYLYQRN